MSTEKVREDRLRRAAKRQGLRLIKSRTRDPRALDYGAYWIKDDRKQVAHGPVPQGFTLDEVERFLTGDQRLRAPSQARNSSRSGVTSGSRLVARGGSVADRTLSTAALSQVGSDTNDR
jgi:hypothetical protein